MSTTALHPSLLLASTSTKRRAVPTPRRTKTTIEVLTIGVLVAVGSVMMTGALLPAHEWNSRQSAIDATGRYIYKTRAVALNSSRTAWLVRDGSVLTVYVDSAGSPKRIGDSMDLRLRYGVNISATQDTLEFDPRGFVASTTVPVFLLSSKHGVDTVCVPGTHRTDASRCP